MPLNQEQRTKLEDIVMDLHYTSSKFIETKKDVHQKMLQVNIDEAIQLLRELKDDLQDDEKLYNYKMHMLIPFQIYELLAMREELKNDEQ